ncbi:hypothetical protein CALCODRAFT_269393 [Calocera cornea HHB12733]|uniref:F-box domain-containing protein n=1 Tax=Calocera cornea HHB12733 TaxID=1353952 RepID=A0A165G8D2_9BASI|nr:hypothetical protein CALCODRAFT_269393 [Calocera cornea HHB12733]
MSDDEDQGRRGRPRLGALFPYSLLVLPPRAECEERRGRGAWRGHAWPRRLAQTSPQARPRPVSPPHLSPLRSQWTPCPPASPAWDSTSTPAPASRRPVACHAHPPSPRPSTPLSTRPASTSTSRRPAHREHPPHAPALPTTANDHPATLAAIERPQLTAVGPSAERGAVIRLYENSPIFLLPPAHSQQPPSAPPPAGSAARSRRTRSPSPRPPPLPAVSAPAPALGSGSTAMPAPAPARIFSDDVQRRLPNEVWLAVFSLLHDSGASLGPASMACKRFSVLTAPLRFRTVAFRSPPLPAPGAGEPDDRSARLAELLLDDKRQLGQHVRTASIASRSPTSLQGRAPPAHVLRALATLSNLESIELQSLDLTADLIRALAQLPALKSLTLLGCVPPKSVVLQSVKSCALALAAITVDNVMKHVYLYEDLLKLLCSPSTRAVHLLGGDPVPSFFLRTLGNQLTHHTLTHLTIPFEGPDPRTLGDFLANQHTLRQLTCTSRTFPRLQLADTTMPLLERFEGPDSPEAYELLARGRPLQNVSIRPLVYANGSMDRLARAFRGLTHSSKPLTELSLKVSNVDAQLLASVADMFPHLRRLVVRSMGALSEELLTETLPTQLRRLPSLLHLHLEHLPKGPDESFSRALPSAATSQAPHILAFSQACPTLRRVRLDKLEWVCVGEREGEWRAWDVTPGFGEEGRRTADVPVGQARISHDARAAREEGLRRGDGPDARDRDGRDTTPAPTTADTAVHNDDTR